MSNVIHTCPAPLSVTVAGHNGKAKQPSDHAGKKLPGGTTKFAPRGRWSG